MRFIFIKISNETYVVLIQKLLKGHKKRTKEKCELYIEPFDIFNFL